MKFLSFFLLALIQLGCRTTPAGTLVTPTTGAAPDTVGRFQNPLLNATPDPWVVQVGGTYYVTYTTGFNITIHKTNTMSRLGASPGRVVWTAPSSGMNSRNIWAPELHRIEGRWYLYYAADDGRNENHRIWVLENAAADPTTGTWTDRGKLNLPEDKWAIDGTIRRINGQLYFAWSGWPQAQDGQQDLYLCRLTNPYTAVGERTRIATPTFSWERQGYPAVNEGPQFLVRNGTLHLVYSASHCSTDAYALGLLTTDTTANLMDVQVWTKTPQPVFGPWAGGGAFGVGHNSFFKSVNGQEDWLLYHANPTANLGCSNRRSARAQSFTWNANDTPNFGTPAPLTEWLKRPAGE
jgi:GH43 family beta-xylosidase